MRGSLVFTALVSAFITLLLWAGLGYPPEVQILPLVVGVPTLSLTMVLLVGEFCPPVMEWLDSALDDLWGGRQETSEANKDQILPSWGPVLRMMSWAAGFFAAVFLFGMFVVPPLFIVAYLVAEARMRLTGALLASLVASTCLYAGMALLRVDLWTGSIAEVVPDILGGGILPPL